MKFKKSYGQVFLRDKKYLYKISRLISLSGKDVLEIGPGSGQLTRIILKQKPNYLICIEKDGGLIPLLKDRFETENVKIINEDILNYNFSHFKNRLVVIGNVPFNISNQLVYFLIEKRNLIEDVFLTLQKEFAQRLAAKPKSKQYSFLSCYLQYYAEVKINFDIPRQAFYPVPRVDSSFVSIKFLPSVRYKAQDEKQLFKLLRYVFNYRRKKIINSLLKFAEREKIAKILAELNIAENSRPEEISLDKFVSIFNKLASRN